MLKEITLATSRAQEIINITATIEDLVTQSEITDGICIISVPHATAALLLNEDEAGIKRDYLSLIDELTGHRSWEHDRIDNNARAHLAATILKSSQTLIIEKGKLIRGTWQELLFVELDGPRPHRRIMVMMSQLA